MLPRKHRLTANQFYRSPHQSRKHHSANFVFITKKASSTFARFVISVPKILDKRSTRRHYTRRVIAAAIYQYLNMLKKPIDILVKPKSIIDKTNIQKIKAEIGKLLENVN